MTELIKNIFDKNSCVNLNIKYLFLLLFLTLLFINIFPYCVKNHHIMHIKFVTIFGHPFDCWSLSHFLFYITLGFLFPHYWKLVLFIGIIWEIYEYIGAHVEKLLFPKEKLYWCAKFSDIIVNTSGFIVGLMIRILISFLIL
jgi:hypothetical protein